MGEEPEECPTAGMADFLEDPEMAEKAPAAAAPIPEVQIDAVAPLDTDGRFL